MSTKFISPSDFFSLEKQEATLLNYPITNALGFGTRVAMTSRLRSKATKLLIQCFTLP